MSKPISFGFGKPKGGFAPKPSPASPASKPPPRPTKRLKNGLHHDSDNEDEAEPQHESVTGFSSSGAILSKPVQQTAERVIQNSGNGDWRRRGKNLLPAEVQAAQNGTLTMVEKDEVSKASGLQFADKSEPSNGVRAEATQPVSNGEHKDMTEDEIAMAALLDDGSGRAKSNAVIQQLGNARLTFHDETADFRADIAARPDSSTLDEYAAMPIEDFGLAMLRGMGQKRRANGEVIDLIGDKKEEAPRKIRKQEGYLGIGAKAGPGSDIELGAWGKADMRKNNKGEGFFTPLMRENKATGERITEEEFQQRLRDSKGVKPEEDWRERRDRNLERSGRDRDKSNGDQKMITNGDDYRDQMTDFSRNSSSSRKDRDERDHDRSSSRRSKDDRDHRSSKSRRDRSRSRNRSKWRDDDYDSRHRDKHRDRYRDDERYESSSSHRSRYRDEDRKHRDKR
jgi:hypothetical protein